jgi:hypothetical protein
MVMKCSHDIREKATANPGLRTGNPETEKLREIPTQVIQCLSRAEWGDAGGGFGIPENGPLSRGKEIDGVEGDL